MKTQLAPQRLVPTGSSGPLSDAVISATPGKHYVYQSVFTRSNPLYALMDCKANKHRSIAHLGELAREVHLHFGFDGTTDIRVSSIKSAQATGLLGHVDADFDDVHVAPADVTIEDFYALCEQRDSAKLVDVCNAACRERQQSTIVAQDIVIAVVTSGHKYGLFLIKELTSESIEIDACHILLA